MCASLMAFTDIVKDVNIRIQILSMKVRIIGTMVEMVEKTVVAATLASAQARLTIMVDQAMVTVVGVEAEALITEVSVK